MSRTTVKTLIISITALLLSAGAFGFYLNLFVSKANTLSLQIENLKIQREQEESHFRLQKIAEESASDRELMAGYFLHSEGGSIDLLNKIEGLAPAAGVQVETNKLELVTKDNDGSDWVEIGFSIKGKRENVQDFIRVIENIPYVSRINSVNLQSVNSTQWDADIIILVRVLNYGE